MKQKLKKYAKRIIVAIIRTEAKLVLKKYKPGIIAITGSVGKTSTKDMIFAALDRATLARKSIKSYNSELGIPLTILGCESGWGSPTRWIKNIFEGLLLIVLKNHYPRWLILEVGADRPGDIKKVAQWIHPDIVVITGFGEIPAHIEFFDSPEALVEEKAHLVKALKENGTLIVNCDDKVSDSMRHYFTGLSMTYGYGKRAAVRAEDEKIHYGDNGELLGMGARVDYGGSSVPLTLKGVLGRQYIYSALAALCVGVRLNYNIVDLVQSLAAHHGTPGRMRIIEGIKGSWIIDDSYNASPAAMEAALETLRDVEASGMKIAVLGDMLELGSYAKRAHWDAGKHVGEICDALLVVGSYAPEYIAGALDGGMSEKNILEFPDAKAAGLHLQNMLKEGDIVLVKGSQGMRMERAVAEIMAHPEKKEAVLVRQEDEWRKR